MTIAPRDAASICKWGLALALATLTFADAQAARLLNPSPPMPASLRTQTKAAALNAYATNIATQQYVMVVQGRLRRRQRERDVLRSRDRRRPEHERARHVGHREGARG